MTLEIWRSRRKLTAAVGLGVVALLAFTGCSRADVAQAGGGEEVPLGSSAELYQQALADMDPVTLIFQTLTSSPDSSSAVPVLAFIDRIEEYSGGKITLETTWANGIVPNVTEVDKALADGRIDIGNFWPQYNPTEYPANNLLLEASVLRDPQSVAGLYAIGGALQQVAVETPEVMAEFTDKGITPLTALQPDGPSVIACSEPVTTLADIAGKQIRAGGTSHARQIEELGAVPVSMPYPEVYEALQRGILDCAMMTPVALTSGGLLEVAPWLMYSTTESFTTISTNLYGGPKFKTLPVAAQQLILESAGVMSGEIMAQRLEQIATETAEVVEANGGQYVAFDSEVDERLAEINLGILHDIADTDVFDGVAFVERVKAANEKWDRLVLDLGYADKGAIVDIPQWFTGTDPEPWAKAVFDEVVAKQLGK